MKKEEFKRLLELFTYASLYAIVVFLLAIEIEIFSKEIVLLGEKFIILRWELHFLLISITLSLIILGMLFLIYLTFSYLEKKENDKK